MLISTITLNIFAKIFSHKLIKACCSFTMQLFLVLVLRIKDFTLREIHKATGVHIS